MMKYISLISIILLLLVSFTAEAKNKKSPNIIYILADDMGQGDVQAYNKDGKIPTPNIDRMAHEGVMFTDAHTNSSVCTPTRYGILTGRYAWRTSLKQGVLAGHSAHLINPDRETVASYLKKQGYNTACFGKWHLGMDWANNAPNKTGRISSKYVNPTEAITNGPLSLGFDYYYGISASLNMDPHAFIENEYLQGTLERVQSMDEMNARGFIQPAKPGWVAKEFKQDEVLATLADKACNWIKDNSEQPFFVYFPLPSPHSPIVPSEKFKGKSGLNLHGDFCMETDWVVGEILKTLDELGLADNTIVVFTADNGTSPKAQLKDMQAKGHYTSYKYRGLKGTTWEGGHRVPFVVRWPEGAKKGAIEKQAICTTDFMATCADLSGNKLADDAGEDSYSFLPALNGKKINGADTRIIVHHSDKGIFAIRKGKWKLMLDNKGGSPRKNPKDKPVVDNAEFLLFDMEKDELESTNLSNKYPEVVENLKSDLAKTIENGRSNPGAQQATDLKDTYKDWKQLSPIHQYLNKY